MLEGQETNEQNSPAVEKAIAFIAKKYAIDPLNIEVSSVNRIEWPDLSLGLPDPEKDEFVIKQKTPGYRIDLIVNGLITIVHTNLDGSDVREKQLY